MSDIITKINMILENDNDSSSFLVYVVDGDEEGTLRIYEDERGWRVKVVEGNIPPSSKKYMSYLTKDDIITWLRKDYDSVREITYDDDDDE